MVQFWVNRRFAQKNTPFVYIIYIYIYIYTEREREIVQSSRSASSFTKTKMLNTFSFRTEYTHHQSYTHSLSIHVRYKVTLLPLQRSMEHNLLGDIYIYIYMHIYIYIHTCMHAYIHTYIQRERERLSQQQQQQQQSYNDIIEGLLHSFFLYVCMYVYTQRERERLSSPRGPPPASPERGRPAIIIYVDNMLIIHINILTKI